MNVQEYAVIDMGSNSIRLMIGVKADDAKPWRFTPKDVIMTRLGEGVDKGGALSAESMERTLEALATWRSRLLYVPVCVVATSAVRDASNGNAFLAEVRARFGWHCRIITGSEEALLGFYGATAKMDPKACILTLDIGSGSTEVAVGTRNNVHWSHSYDMGAVRLKERWETELQSFEKAVAHCNETWVPMDVKPTHIVGIGGTITTAAAMVQKLDVYDPQKINHYSLALKDVIELIPRLSALSQEERLAIRGLPPQRRDIIIPGLLILWSFMSHYKYMNIIVSDCDLMEGVFYRHAFHDAAWRNGPNTK